MNFDFSNNVYHQLFCCYFIQNISFLFFVLIFNGSTLPNHFWTNTPMPRFLKAFSSLWALSFSHVERNIPCKMHAKFFSLVKYKCRKNSKFNFLNINTIISSLNEVHRIHVPNTTRCIITICYANWCTRTGKNRNKHMEVEL